MLTPKTLDSLRRVDDFLAWPRLRLSTTMSAPTSSSSRLRVRSSGISLSTALWLSASFALSFLGPWLGAQSGAFVRSSRSHAFHLVSGLSRTENPHFTIRTRGFAARTVVLLVFQHERSCSVHPVPHFTSPVTQTPIAALFSPSEVLEGACAQSLLCSDVC